MEVTRIAVFCGSRLGTNVVYETHAIELGKLLAEQKFALVYGGGNKGLMGAVANAVMQNNGEVIGVIPEILLEWERKHDAITKLHVVKDMHVRKKMMYELCSAAIILPGGHGTLDELFEMVTWNTLNIHNKKIIILNSGGYYNHLMAHIEMMLKEEFLYSDWRERILVCNDPSEVIAALV